MAGRCLETQSFSRDPVTVSSLLTVRATTGLSSKQGLPVVCSLGQRKIGSAPHTEARTQAK